MIIEENNKIKMNKRHMFLQLHRLGMEMAEKCLIPILDIRFKSFKNHIFLLETNKSH